jgi:bifunctional UDP-N-acetylglucosamine pyrophosphorylase/glucosamine-1-phosphate N-acetyltransferase
VGAGSVITKSVPAGALAVARARQEMREGWAARKKKTREAKD